MTIRVTYTDYDDEVFNANSMHVGENGDLWVTDWNDSDNVRTTTTIVAKGHWVSAVREEYVVEESEAE